MTEVAKLLSEIKNPIFWYALYTRPRWEKKVAERVEKKGFEVYCPLNKVRRKWSDRYKVVEEPLFKSYVFVKLDLTEQARIRLTDGVVNFVYWQGAPAVVQEQEILLIKRFLNECTEVEVVKMELEQGMKVRIKSGLMMHQEGWVVDVKNNRVSVFLESLGYTMTALFDKQNLELSEPLNLHLKKQKNNS